MALEPTLSDQEIETAEKRLSFLTRLPINRAVRFHNSLQAFLRDVDRAQREEPPLIVRAVDTSEIIAALDYDHSSFRGFTFGGLLEKQQTFQRNRDRIYPRYNLKADLLALDKLILQHLLEGRAEGFLLLDPHAEELMDVRSAIERRFNDLASRLFSIDLTEFSGFYKPNLDSVRSYILSQRGEAFKKEWLEFCAIFLPTWREDMVNELADKSFVLKSIDQFMANGRYLFLRNILYGNRSVISFINAHHKTPFDWNRYKAFVGRQDVSECYQYVWRLVTRLINVITRQSQHKRDQRLMDLAAERDGRVFATVHILNGFLKQSDINARVELITRSPTLHDVIASLPQGALRVTIRHPLLIPDIYRYDVQSISAIGEIVQKVDLIIKPYLDGFRFASNETITRENELRSFREVSAIASEMVPILKNLLSIQQTLEQAPDTFRSIFDRVYTGIGEFRSNKDQRNDANSADSILKIFELIAERLSERDDPFSSIVSSGMLKRNLALVEFEKSRTFSANESFRVRLLNFEDDNQFMPCPCSVIRLVHPAFSRLFHLYSGRIRNRLKKYMATKSVGNRDQSKEPQEVVVPVSFFFEDLEAAVKSTFEGHRSRKLDGRDDILYNAEATLLACLAFASRKRFDTAVTLASAILRRVTEGIRKGERWGRGKEELRRCLAYREIFLLRHYCERGAALQEYFDAFDGGNKGLVTKNFARAQRDLDFAALMSEEVERCIISDANEQSVPWKSERPKNKEDDELAVAPAGAKSLRDYRLRLAHLGGWLDLLLVISDGMYRSWPGSSGWKENELERIRRRFDIWTGLGLVKENIVDAFNARQAEESRNGSQEVRTTNIRYFSHIEARALQSALTMLLLFLAYKITPEIQYLWGFYSGPETERILAFRDWKIWWNRYRELRREYRFSMRMELIIDHVCAALQDIEEHRGRVKVGLTKDEHRRVLEQLLDSIRKIEAPGVFTRVLTSALRERLEEMIKGPLAEGG